MDSDKAFRIPVTVRFGDCDPAGIVYYPTIYHYCHVAFEEAWSGALGIPYPVLVSERRLGFPTVHVETDFTSPLRYGDTVEIVVTVPRVGESSVDFVFEGFAGSLSVFRSSHTKVCTDLDALEKRPIPDEIRRALAAMAG